MLALAQKEKQQVQHQEQADDDEVRGALTDGEGLSGKELAALLKGGRQSLLRIAEIAESQAVQQISCPWGQRVQELLKKPAEINLSRLDPFIQACRFLQQRHAVRVSGRSTIITMIRTVVRAARLRLCGMVLNSRRWAGANTVAKTIKGRRRRKAR